MVKAYRNGLRYNLVGIGSSQKYSFYLPVQCYLMVGRYNVHDGMANKSKNACFRAEKMNLYLLIERSLSSW